MTEYPEEIYYTIDGEPAPRWLLVDEDAKTRLERAYDLGKKHAAEVSAERLSEIIESYDPDEDYKPHAIKSFIGRSYRAGLMSASQKEESGWSNLTAAIKDGENIDWEKLDGLPAKCVHSELGAFTNKLERYKYVEVDMPYGWYTNSDLRSNIFVASWGGYRGWSLWVKGTIPLKKKTADELPLGMCFKGLWRSSVKMEDFIRIEWKNGNPGVIPMLNFGESYRADSVEVIEEYGIGTFKKES